VDGMSWSGVELEWAGAPVESTPYPVLVLERRDDDVRVNSLAAVLTDAGIGHADCDAFGAGGGAAGKVLRQRRGGVGRGEVGRQAAGDRNPVLGDVTAD
jgi:hypothetical protein